jgi:hypothetical protein
MKISSKLIAKILTLCGISLTCTACYAPPKSAYHNDTASDYEIVIQNYSESEADETADFSMVKKDSDEE